MEVAVDLRCVVECAHRLGEGPVWSPREGRIYWFDIKGMRLAWFDPASGEDGGFDLPVRASAAAPRTAGGLLVATEAGLGLFDTREGRLDIVESMDLGPGFRTNDGKIDLAGDFWWSTMDDDGGRRPGAIYRTDRLLRTRQVLAGIHIPNTISVSPDGRLLYLADSKLQTIFVYDTADLGKVRVFAETRGQAAYPDGSAVDAEGYLWNAQWGAARLVRYAPDGQIERIVPMPVDQPTSCAFGGPDLGTLYVTSAWDELSEPARAAQPRAGHLFAFEPGVKGLALPLFEG